MMVRLAFKSCCDVPSKITLTTPAASLGSHINDPVRVIDNMYSWAMTDPL